MDLLFTLFEKPIQIANTIIIVFAGLFLPFLGLGIIFGLAGSTSHYYALIAISYIGILLFGILTYFRPKFFIGTVTCCLLIITGFALDSLFWKRNNADLCKEIRVEPSCTESESGYVCTNFDGANISFPKSVCK